MDVSLNVAQFTFEILQHYFGYILPILIFCIRVNVPLYSPYLRVVTYSLSFQMFLRMGLASANSDALLSFISFMNLSLLSRRWSSTCRIICCAIVSYSSLNFFMTLWLWTSAAFLSQAYFLSSQLMIWDSSSMHQFLDLENLLGSSCRLSLSWYFSSSGQRLYSKLPLDELLMLFLLMQSLRLDGINYI